MPSTTARRTASARLRTPDLELLPRRQGRTLRVVIAARPDLRALIAAIGPGPELVAVRDGAAVVVAVAPSEVRAASGSQAIADLDDLTSGWWAGWLGYDLGRAVERVVPRLEGEGDGPDIVLARFDARLVLLPGAHPRVVGDGPGRLLLERALADAVTSPATGPHGAPTRPAAPVAAAEDQWTSSLDEDAWCAAVATIREHILAGDCYQVNLTRRLTNPTSVDVTALHAAVVAANPAPHAALVRLRGLGIVSASPERFLSVEPGPAGARVQTRPIKGTAARADVLVASEKDRAENVMIVDLARNDLGRVCVPGTMRVPALCAVEAHPGLHHLVSTVEGVLAPGVGWGGLVAATFPPASVTGAPKPRVLQIIEDLEPLRRGVYCGAIGWIDADAGRADLNVAIRTFVVRPDRLELGVGAGIVADSDALAEWHETELKARRLLAAANHTISLRSSRALVTP
jgi:para-aminobenzoate synthetase component 1